MGLLLTIAALSWMPDYVGVTSFGITPFFFAVALTAALALAVLWGLGLLAMNFAARPLLNKISELPVERIEITVLRAMTTMFDRLGAGFMSDSSICSGAEIAPILQQLEDVVEGNLSKLRERIVQLFTAAEALTAAVNALSRITADALASEVNAHEFNAGIDRLTEKLDQVIVAAEGPPDRLIPRSGDANGARSPRANGDIQQLRDLLKEFD